MRNRFILLLAVFSLVVAACGSDAEEATTTTAADDGTTETTAAGGGDGGGDAGAQTGESTLDQVIARGELNCGVNEELPGFGVRGSDGELSGFDIDFCRAIAAAVLGDADAVRYEALTAAQRFEAINSGQIDVLSRNTTWTQSRDTELGADFGPTLYYDGQQVMAKISEGFSASSTLSDLEGAVVCVGAGTTTEKNISEALDALGVDATVQTFEEANTILEQFKSGACNAFTADGSALVARKAANPEGTDWVIFPEVPLSKEPLGPAWQQNDSVWGDVVNWTIFAMIIAEEAGVDSSNVADAQSNPPNDEISRLLGGEGELQTGMGLPADAFFQVISQVGNYGEVFERNLTPLNIERGLNQLWSDGGLLYAPPAR